VSRPPAERGAYGGHSALRGVETRSQIWTNFHAGCVISPRPTFTPTAHSTTHVHASVIERGSPQARPPACQAAGTNCALIPLGTGSLMTAAHTYRPLPFSSADFRGLKKAIEARAPHLKLDLYHTDTRRALRIAHGTRDLGGGRPQSLSEARLRGSMVASKLGWQMHRGRRGAAV
jgi:hypothetical protein